MHLFNRFLLRHSGIGVTQGIKAKQTIREDIC